MTVKIEFETDNAAFNDDITHEIARTLKETFKRIELGYEYGNIRDVNGNSIGKYELTLGDD